MIWILLAVLFIAAAAVFFFLGARLTGDPQARGEAARRITAPPECSQGMFSASECDDPKCPLHRPSSAS